MRQHLVWLLGIGLSLTVSTAALAQSGQFACEQDLKNIEEMFREKQSALTPAERQDAQELLRMARTKCASEGSSGITTRSKEASMLLDKLQNAPSPSTAAAPK